MKSLSVIFPAYNEATRIGPVLKQFDDLLRETKISYELIVVDDGSTDDTVRFVGSLCESMSSLRLVTSLQNMGKGHAIRLGMLSAKGNVRMFSDADGSTPPTEINKLLEPLLAGKADIVIGSRYLAGSEVQKKQPLFRRVWSRLANAAVQKILLPGIVDPHCGFKAFSAEAAMQIFPLCSVNGWSFDLEVLALARYYNLRMSEVPVKWVNDERSRGKLSHLPREIRSVYEIKRNMKQLAEKKHLNERNILGHKY